MVDPRHKVASFGATTGTGSLRNHLCTDHIHDWVSSCDQQGIKITAKGVQEAVEAYRQNQGKEASNRGEKC